MMSCSILDGFKNNAIHLPKRELANVKILKYEFGSPWDRLCSTCGFIDGHVQRVIEIAFERGGYVAGGFARWERTEHPNKPSERSCYIKLGGDIDLFFRDEQGWGRFVEEVESQNLASLSMSKGHFAINMSVKNRNSSPANKCPVIQAIQCAVGEPEKLLRGFDLLNSMIAFDRTHAWVAQDWDRMERSRAIGVMDWSSRGLIWRIQKYLTKYGYQSVRDASGDRCMEQLQRGLNTLGEHSRELVESRWRGLVTSSIHFEDDIAVQILALVAQSGVEASDLHTIVRSKDGWANYIGKYRSELTALIHREIGDSAFNADEYCWTI